jgi:hypothetical protein
VHLTGVDRFFWAFGFLAHCVLFAVVWVRHRAARFPVFTTLIAVDILRTIVLYFTMRFGSSGDYFYAYWTLAFVDLVLQLGLAYELTTHVFQPLGAWAPDVRRSFIALSATSILLAAGLAWLAVPPAKALRLAIIIRGDLFASALMSELFVAMVALSVTLGLPWRTHVARLAQGFGIFALFGTLTDAAHSWFGVADTYKLVSHLQIGLYNVCVIYWIVTLTMEEPAPRKIPQQLHEELRELQRKAETILRSLRASY